MAFEIVEFSWKIKLKLCLDILKIKEISANMTIKEWIQDI